MRLDPAKSYSEGEAETGDYWIMNGRRKCSVLSLEKAESISRRAKDVKVPESEVVVQPQEQLESHTIELRPPS